MENATFETLFKDQPNWVYNSYLKEWSYKHSDTNLRIFVEHRPDILESGYRITIPYLLDNVGDTKQLTYLIYGNDNLKSVIDIITNTINIFDLIHDNTEISDASWREK